MGVAWLSGSRGPSPLRSKHLGVSAQNINKLCYSLVVDFSKNKHELMPL